MTEQAPAETPPPVLVADDDQSVRTLFRTLLEEAGLSVVEAADGPTAVAVARSRRLGAVVLDSNMPGLDGLGVLAELRSRRETWTLPVLFVTGSTAVQDRVRGLEAGASDYLTKPVDGEELVARVRAQLRGQAAWMSEVEVRLRERATVTDRLCRLRPAADPLDTATQFCQELIATDDGLSAALVGFHDGGALPLALHGEGVAHFEVGRPLPHRLAARLRARVAQGAWTEHAHHQPPGSLGVPLFNPAVPTAAYAVMRGPEYPLGLLALARPDAPLVERDLSAVIDYAAVATALLGPALAEQYEISGRQTRLREIMQQQAYAPFFQPIVDLTDRAAVGHEVLTRFHDGIAPDQRFGEAAALGMSVEVERSTIAAAIGAAGNLPDSTWLSINVSPTLLLGDPDLNGLLAGADRAVVVELTEHDPIGDYQSVRHAIERLGTDVRLSVDDAGSGYACLHHVLALEPDYIKLDRRWVHGIDRDPARQALVAGLSHFARQTRSVLIAEGIEAPSELQALTDLGVNLGQGFLLGRPAPVGAGEALP